DEGGARLRAKEAVVAARQASSATDSIPRTRGVFRSRSKPMRAGAAMQRPAHGKNLYSFPPPMRRTTLRTTEPIVPQASSPSGARLSVDRARKHHRKPIANGARAMTLAINFRRASENDDNSSAEPVRSPRKSLHIAAPAITAVAIPRHDQKTSGRE